MAYCQNYEHNPRIARYKCKKKSGEVVNCCKECYENLMVNELADVKRIRVGRDVGEPEPRVGTPMG